MLFEKVREGIIIRVRLTPNSSSCSLGGKIILPNDEEYLKINVVSVPEKGKANLELIRFLAKSLRTAKSDWEIISGEQDRYKKLLYKGEAEELVSKWEVWLEGMKK